MARPPKPQSSRVAWILAGCAVLCAGFVLASLHVVTVVRELRFLDEAVGLEAPGRYRVQAARATTWTLLQELSPTGARAPVSVKVRAVGGQTPVAVAASAQGYSYERGGVVGFSAYDFHLPQAGEYDVELSSAGPVSVRLVDDVAGRLLAVRHGVLRGGAFAGGALLLALACFAAAALATRGRQRSVSPPARRPAATPPAVARQARPAGRPPRNLQVLPALPTDIALQRYGLEAPRASSRPRPRLRPDLDRVPSVA